MGLFDDVFSTFDNAISGIFGGSTSTSGSYLGGSSAGGSSFLPLTPEYGPPAPYNPPAAPAVNVMAGAPMIIAGTRALAARFPNLAAAVGALTAQFGTKFSPDKVVRMLKQYGPNLVGGLIGAAALNELVVWQSTHKRRRMNVANTRALRRSMRRLKGFDRMASRVSAQLSRAGGRRRSSRRCGTCRKSPCSC